VGYRAEAFSFPPTSPASRAPGRVVLHIRPESPAAAIRKRRWSDVWAL